MIVPRGSLERPLLLSFCLLAGASTSGAADAHWPWRIMANSLFNVIAEIFTVITPYSIKFLLIEPLYRHKPTRATTL